MTQANGIALGSVDDLLVAFVKPLLANQQVRVAGTRDGKPRRVAVRQRRGVLISTPAASNRISARSPSPASARSARRLVEHAVGRPCRRARRRGSM